MEDFLREKLSHGGEHFADDWAVFEQKLERAMFFKQMRVGAMVSVVLILLSIGFFSSSSFSRFNVFHNDNSTEAYRGDGRFSDFKANKNASIQGGETRVGDELQNRASGFGGQSNEAEIAGQNATTTGSDHLEKITDEQAVEQDPPALFVDSLNSDITIKENSSALAENTSTVYAQGLATQNMADTGGRSEDQSLEASAAPIQSEISKKELEKSSTGMALVPDGLESSNYKFNAKPIELMVDLDDLKTPSLKAPVIPMKIVKAEKEAYVSPLQEKSPWSYSIKVYPNFTYRKFSVAANKMAYIHRDFIDQVKVSETGGFSMNVGFEASKRIGRITYLNGGVEYISYKTEANFDFVNYRDAVINSESGKITSYDFRNEPDHIVIVDANRYHYLNFPLSISYRPWATDHVRLNIEAGASYMYFIKATGKSLDYQTLDVIDLSERDYRNSMASVCLKVGASYHLSEKFSLGFEPTVVYFSNTIYTEEYPFEVVPYSVGLNFKLQIKLN